MTQPFQLRLLSTMALLAIAGAAVWVWKKPFAASPVSPAPLHHPQAVKATPKLPLHPVVKQIVGEGPTTPYLKLNYIIKELPTDLAQHDVDALIAFITAPQPQKFSDSEWGSLTNDIQEALSVQVVPNEKVAQALITTYRDESRSQMMRDYALQHIGGFASYLIYTAGTRAEPLPPFFGNLVEELKSATSDGSKPWAGTALNLLDGLLRAAEYRNTTIPGLTAESLVAVAIPIARNISAPLNARLPALQVAARHDSPDARALAREILSSPEPGIMLTQSAAAALARLGTSEDLPLLQSIAANASRHTAPALNEAIRSIQDRTRPN